jgi:Flp pilus assembly protein TadD
MAKLYPQSASRPDSSSPTHPSQNAGVVAAAHAEAANQAWRSGDFSSAIQHFSEATRLVPDNAQYRYGLACCHIDAGELDAAGQHFQMAANADPRSAPTQMMLGMWYVQQGMLAEAIGATSKAVELDPTSTDAMVSHATALEISGDIEGAWKILEPLHARGERSNAFARLFARMARWRGRRPEALDLVFQLLGDPATAALSRAELHLSAADLLDSLGRYDEAFAHAARGNAIRRPAYDRLSIHRDVQRTMAYFSARRLAALPKSSNRSEKPVFIVGMPRSGTSLVEQILASHPGVYGAGELDFMYRTCIGTIQMLRSSLNNYPECLDDLSLNHADGMSDIYLGPLIALNPTAMRITDKMPLNFFHLGLISRLLPGAKIIHCRRNAMDTCLSCHMAHFSAGNNFKYDLTDLGMFYRDYEALMSHWKQVLDPPILDVDYEHLVADPGGQSRRMIQFIGLPWDQRCLRPHETRRPTATASVQQVRQPIYQTSVERWRHYERFLQPLQIALSGAESPSGRSN